jgi:hypothetical protein
VPQRLDYLEDNRVAERGVGGIEAPLSHHAFAELAGRHRAVDAEMMGADVGDLALLEEPMADQIARPLLLGLGEQPDRRVDVGEVVLGVPRQARGRSEICGVCGRRPSLRLCRRNWWRPICSTMRDHAGGLRRPKAVTNAEPDAMGLRNEGISEHIMNMR